MKMIDIESLIKEINSKKKKELIIEFNGLITSSRKIRDAKIYEDENMINIIAQNAGDEKIQLLKHQIMKIEKTEDEYIIKFDALQNVKIKEQI